MPEAAPRRDLKQDFWRPLGQYLAYYRNHRREFWLATTLACIKHSPVLLIPFYTKYIFDSAIPMGAVGDILLCGAGILALLVVNVTLHPLYIRIWSGARRDVAVRLRSLLCERLQQVSFSYFDSHQGGRLHSKVMQDVEKLDTFGRLLVEPLITQVLTAVVSLAIILIIQPLFAVAVLALVPAMLLLRKAHAARMEQRFQQLRVEQEKLNAEVNELIGMVPMARVHATEREDLRKLTERLGTVRAHGVETDWRSNLYQSQLWCLFQVANMLVIVGGAWMVVAGWMTIGQVVLFMSLLMMTLGGVNMLTANMEHFFAASQAMRSINEVLLGSSVEQNEGKPELSVLEGRIEFADVTFTYPGCGEPVIRGASIRVEPNQTIALVGPSGSGKSTFIKLMLGLYSPDTGRVLVDGQDLRAFDLRSLRRQVGVVTQDTFLFNGTILENLTHGLGQIPLEAVHAAARNARADEFIAALSQGYETEIGDRGVRLSGGQKQRLAIARALLRNPRLLLLDEATSALDSESERAVQNALEFLMEGRTTFLIAHRLSTVRNADRIFVFDQGRIVEEGGHEELLARRGVYARLVELQTVA